MRAQRSDWIRHTQLRNHSRSSVIIRCCDYFTCSLIDYSASSRYTLLYNAHTCSTMDRMQKRVLRARTKRGEKRIDLLCTE